MPRSDLLADRVPAAKNQLLAALPSKDRARLLASGEDVELEFGKTLIEPGGRIRHVYFPTDGSYISFLTPVDGGSWRSIVRSAMRPERDAEGTQLAQKIERSSFIAEASRLPRQK